MKQTKLDAGETLEEVLSAGAQRNNNCLLLRQKIDWSWLVSKDKFSAAGIPLTSFECAPLLVS